MTAFTADTVFVDLGVAIVGERYGSGGVTIEAAFDTELWVGDAVKHARSVRNRFRTHGFLSRRGAVGVCGGVPGGIIFQVPILIDPCYESAGLTACAEDPFKREIHQVCAIVNVDPESAIFAQDFVAVLSFAGELDASGEIFVIRRS